MIPRRQPQATATISARKLLVAGGAGADHSML